MLMKYIMHVYSSWVDLGWKCSSSFRPVVRVRLVLCSLLRGCWFPCSSRGTSAPVTNRLFSGGFKGAASCSSSLDLCASFTRMRGNVDWDAFVLRETLDFPFLAASPFPKVHRWKDLSWLSDWTRVGLMLTLSLQLSWEGSFSVKLNALEVA